MRGKVHCYSKRHGKEYSEPGDVLDDIMACYFFRCTLLIPFFSLLLVYLSEEWKKIQLRTWTKNADVSFAKVTNGDTLKRWSTVSVVGTNGLISFYSLHATLLKQKGSLIVFSCFVSYEGYHKEGNLDFEQRMVKELLELLKRKYHSFSTLMQT